MTKRGKCAKLKITLVHLDEAAAAAATMLRPKGTKCGNCEILRLAVTKRGKGANLNITLLHLEAAAAAPCLLFPGRTGARPTVATLQS